MMVVNLPRKSLLCFAVKVFLRDLTEARTILNVDLLAQGSRILDKMKEGRG